VLPALEDDAAGAWHGMDLYGNFAQEASAIASISASMGWALSRSVA